MPRTDPTIRLAQQHDAAAIAQLSRDTIETGLGWSWRQQRVAASIRDPQSLCIVVGARPILGFCITQFGEELAHLSLLAVDPRHRRRGLGSSLVSWMLASARTAGIATIHVEMRANNSEARCFYHALGFEMGDLVRGYYQGVEAAQRMVLRLRPDGSSQAVWEIPLSWRGPARTSDDSGT
jgi:ribosomal protein S18 acetylase RimI-like enzyme